MKLVFHFLFREKFWLILSIVTVLFASSLALAQAGVFSQFATLLVRMDASRPKPEADKDTLRPGASIWEKTVWVAEAYKKEGSKRAAEKMLALESRFFILFFGVATALVIFLLQLFQYLKDLSTNYLAIRIAA